MSSSSTKRGSGLAAFLVAASSVLLAASGTAQDIGIEGPQFAPVTSTPTESKPESKLWYHDGIWWGCLWSLGANAFHIHRLDFTTHVWTDTGVAIESRPDSHSDALSDGDQLYIATHEFAGGGGTIGNPILVLRYTYDPSTQTYSQDAGFPVTIGDFSNEALTIYKDSTGTLWAAWCQGRRVHFSHTLGTDTQWSAPAILPGNTTDVTTDDICGLIAFNGDRIGILWSDQVVNAYRFSVHLDGAPDTVWSVVENVTTGETEDHLNLKAHSDGRVFFVGKNNQNSLLLFQRALNGTWTRHLVSGPNPIFHQPILLLDEPADTLHVFVPDSIVGEVHEKTSPISNISFVSGPGIVRMRDDSAVFRISNPTSTKQNVDSTTGYVVLAHHDTTGSYWHHDVPPSAVPVASFSASPISGARPLHVQFTDTSTGSPTSRLWHFGDGTTSTLPSPEHVYDALGRYTVTLEVSNAAGSDEITKVDLITVGIGAVADTYVRDHKHQQDHGSESILRSRRKKERSEYESYLRFDLSGNGPITTSTLRIFSPSTAGTVGVQVYLVSDAWTEHGLTWANRPAATQLIAVQNGLQGSGWIEIDLGNALAGRTVASLAIIAAGNNDKVDFSSRESAQVPLILLE